MDHSESGGPEVVAFVVYYGLAALLLGYFASRKNRSLGWAFIGPLFCVPSLIAMAFMSYLCPKCRGPMTYDEWKQKRCPRCDVGTGQIADQRPERTDYTECPSCATMIPPAETKCPKC